MHGPITSGAASTMVQESVPSPCWDLQGNGAQDGSQPKTVAKMSRLASGTMAGRPRGFGKSSIRGTLGGTAGRWAAADGPDDAASKPPAAPLPACAKSESRRAHAVGLVLSEKQASLWASTGAVLLLEGWPGCESSYSSWPMNLMAEPRATSAPNALFRFRWLFESCSWRSTSEKMPLPVETCEPLSGARLTPVSSRNRRSMTTAIGPTDNPQCKGHGPEWHQTQYQPSLA
mmetsp:Transcript_59715/g.134619  ORF Transcript_59715/g.134619 Transcript_59715/m.134619 type:complete len:231 (-) Transcript_59715:4-696(-)